MRQRTKKQRFIKMRRIRRKLILAFALIFFIPTMTVGGFSFFNAKNTVEEEMLAAVNESLNVLNASITKEIETKIHHAEFYAENIPANLHEENIQADLRADFKEYLALHPEAASIYAGTDDNVFILEPYFELWDDFDVTERDWYQTAKEKNGEAVISEPYLSGDGKMVVTIAQMMENGRGVVGIDIDLAYLQGLTNQIKVGDNGYAVLMDGNYNFLAHPKQDAGTKANGEIYDKIYEQNEGDVPTEQTGEKQIVRFMTNELTGWKLAGTFYVDEVNEHAAPILRATALVFLVAILIGTVAVYFIIHSIMVPLRELRDRALAISRGDLNGSLEINTDDELGQLGVAFNDMQDSLRNLVENMSQSAGQLTEASEELTANASQTTSAAEQAATVIQEVADSAEQQTQKVEENTQSLEQISNDVMRIAKNAAKVTEYSRQAAQAAEDGGIAVSATVTQMKSIYETVTQSNQVVKRLNERAQEVTAILAVITDIADQTNLLALNAAIEAARAGENGRGFTVVAEEVRKLAEESRESVNKIREIVEGIQTETNDSVTMMDRVMEDVLNGVDVSEDAIDKFNRIVEAAKEITPQMEDVAASAQQMAVAVQRISGTSNELLAIAQENAATSEEVAASSEEQLASIEEITASSKTLAEMAEKLDGLVAHFKY